MDYIIISDFDILDFDGTLSDIHCPIYAAFRSIPQILAHDKVRNCETPNMGGSRRIKYKWNANFIDIYKANVTNFKNNIEESIHQAEVKTSLLGDAINNIVNGISEALKKAAYNSGMGKSLKKTKLKNRRRQLQHKPWYNKCCEKSRKTMIKCRNNYRRQQSLVN